MAGLEMKQEDFMALVQSTVEKSVLEVMKANMSDGKGASFADAMALLKSHIAPQLAENPSNYASKYLRVIAHAKQNKDAAASFISRAYGGDEVLKTMVLGEDGTNNITPETVAAELIELLRPASVVRRMNPVVLPVNTASIMIPKQTGGASATYIGSNDSINATGITFGMLQMVFKKCAALVPVSNDLLKYSSPSAEGVIRDDLVYALAAREDEAFLRGDGTSNTPKGMRYWAPTANVLQANGTVNLANTIKDLGRAICQLMESDCRMLRCGWIIAPRTFIYLTTLCTSEGQFPFRDEMLRGTLMGYPFAVSNRVPTNLGSGTKSEIYLADFADLVIAENMNIQVTASQEATITEGGNTISAFQQDATVLRAISEHDFGCRHPESIAVLYDVAWVLT